MTTGKNTNEAVQLMNTALEKISRWFIANKLQLNPSKTRYMIFNNKETDHIYVTIKGEKFKRFVRKGKRQALN